jgi:NADH-quinone oxidoreductase subunit L
MPQPIYLALVVAALPLCAFAIELLYALFARRMPKWNHVLSTAAIFAALGCSAYLLFTEVLGRPHGIQPAYAASFPWIFVSGDSPIRVDFDVMVDNLTVIMLVVVTLVSSLVHLYASSYMKGQERYSRFFSYLSLFTFSMLGLCITSNMLMLFIFWELVGLCSYFLIGFFIEKKSAGDASKKAFITNRVGDACFMAAICITFSLLSKTWSGEGVLNLPKIYESIGMLGAGGAEAAGPWAGNEGLLTLVGVLFFMGCVTKSAQFPLHIWLPDAMEGPTPVSALIHAATMVAAGVYMIVRMFPLLVGPGYLDGEWFGSDSLQIIALIGGFTSIFAGSIALVQKDLKKGLAYSTCSQLGYMAMAVGVGSITGGMFHLFTHAFFKACLFLGAGSVIHAVHSQLMSDMGGLRRKMPITFWTFFISTLAIAGIPFTSGFLSKEMVLTSALAYGEINGGGLVAKLPFYMAAATACLTAFYMFRMVFLTFFGKGAWEDGGAKHAAAAPAHAAHGGRGSHGGHADPHEHGAHAAGHDGHGHGAHAPAAAAHGGGHGRDDHGHHGEPHESPFAMALPLVVLGVLGVVSAGVGFPGAPGSTWFEHRVNDGVLVKNLMTESTYATEATRALFDKQFVHDPSVDAAEITSSIGKAYADAWRHAHGVVFAFSLIAAPTMILLAIWFFIKKRGVDYVSKNALLVAIRGFFENLWYVDALIIRGFVPLVAKFFRFVFSIDKYVVDASVNAAAWLTERLSFLSGRVDYHGVDGAVRGTGTAMLEGGDAVRKLVTGKINDYVLYTVLGLAALVLAVIVFA